MNPAAPCGELRERGDIGSFHYSDNLARTLRLLGEIILDLIPKIYDTRRVITILREDDKEERVALDPHAAKAFSEEKDDQGRQMKVFNPTIGKYGVAVTIGPSYATKRVEASESMMDFARALGPNVVPLIMDLVAKNMDWPGGDEIAARLAKAVPPQLMTPDVKGVSPQVQAVLNNLEQQTKQLQQELVVAQRQLLDQDKDRAIKLEKIEKDFEAKLLAVAQKSDAEAKKHVGLGLQQLLKEVAQLREGLANPEIQSNG